MNNNEERPEENPLTRTGTLPPPVTVPPAGEARPSSVSGAADVAAAGCNGNCNAAASDEGGGALSFVYAIGRVGARFPSLSVEKEFSQAIGRADTAGQTDSKAFHSVLSQPQNRYLARHMCYVFSIEGLETYILQPHDPVDLALLIDAIRPSPSPMDVDVVVGIKGPLAPASLCNGLVLPLVFIDQMYSFDRPTLLKAIPKPKEMKADEFASSSNELLDRIMQMADNSGATDEHRVLNYLAVRYPAIYARVHEAHQEKCSLTGLEVRPSRLSGSRKIFDVILSYTHRETDVTHKDFVRVDVTEEFPFLVTKLTPYYDR